MSTDWREKERQFLTSLKADTGRDLGEWMRVIAAQNLPHRNDIIDWLRQQGFAFARASWLERIHHNQGRPIYLDAAELAPAASQADTVAEVEGALQRVVAGGSRMVFMAAPTTAPASSPLPPVPIRTMPPPCIAAETPRALPDHIALPGDVPANVAAGDVDDAGPVTGTGGAAPATGDEMRSSSEIRASAAAHVTAGPLAAQAGGTSTVPPRGGPVAGALSPAVDEVLAKAKAYRPLAMHLLRMMEGAVAGMELVAGPGHLLLSGDGGTPFGLIAVSGKDVRLVLRLQTEVACAPMGPVRLPVTLSRTASGMTHMAVLTDARQLDETLINLVRKAAGA